MNAAGVLGGSAGTWPSRAIAALAEIFAPRRAKNGAAERAGAVGRAPADGPEPDAARRFRAAALPLLDDAYSFARYLCRDADAAEDIVQDAYVRALRFYPAFRGETFKPWLFAIVRNCFLDWTKAGRREVRPEAAADADEPRDEETPETLLIKNDERQALRALIGALPVQYREVLVLRELDQLSYREIASAIDAPTGTVMSRLARARERLAEAWRRREAQAGGGA